MEIAPENDAAKAKRQAILTIMRDTTLTAQEKQKRIQALHTAPDHAVAVPEKMAPSPPTQPAPEPEPSSSPSPPPEDAKPPAASQVAPESAPEVDLASPPASRGSRRRARSRPGSTETSAAMSVTPSPAPVPVVAMGEASPEAAAARKRRDEIMNSATWTGRTRARAGGVRTGARSSRRRSVAKIGRSSFIDSASGDDNDDGIGEDKEKEEQRQNSGDVTAVISAASRPARSSTRRGRRRLADARANSNTANNDDDSDFEDDRKPAAVQLMAVASSAPSPMGADDRQQTRPGVVAVSAIDERIARKQSSNLGAPSGRSAVVGAAAAASVEAAAEPSAAPVAPTSSATSSGDVKVGAFSCTDLDDKIARKTVGEGRRAGSASAFSVTASTHTSRSNARKGGGDTSVNTGARSHSMMPSRAGGLGGDGNFVSGSRSVSMYSSRRQRRQRSGSGIDAGVGAMAAVANVSEKPVPEIRNTTTDDEEHPVDEKKRAETTFTAAQQPKPPCDKPHHVCCKECGRPYTPPEVGDGYNDTDESPQVIGGSESRRSLLAANSTEIASGDDMDLGVEYESALNDIEGTNPEQSGEWGSRHSSVLSTTGSGDWGSRGTADSHDFVDDALGVLDGSRTMKPSENEEDSLCDEAKTNDEGDYRGTAAALNFDDMDLASQDGGSHGNVPPTTSNVDCSVDDITVRRGSLEHGVQGVSEESLAFSDLERAAAKDHAPNGDANFAENDGTYNEDEDYYYDEEDDQNHDQNHDQYNDQYHAPLQDSYNPAHHTDPFDCSDHFFADNFMDKGPATRTRARRESFKDGYNYEGFALSRDDKCNLLIGLLLIIVVTIGVSVPVTLIKKEANAAKNVPTMSPTLVRDSEYTAMLDQIVLETDTPTEVFGDDDAPQTQALQWVAYDDAAGLTADSPNLIQRYSLMCLFFGSGGSSTLLGWDEDGADDECSWLGVECKSKNVTSNLANDTSTTTTLGSASGHVTSLDLKRTRLAGSLVSEVGSFPHLESLNIGENFLKGAIPSTLYDLSKLRSLIMEKNFFGPYLTEGIGRLVLLETLSLNDNRFESDLPSTLVNLKAMKHLSLFSNSFSGRLVEYILQMPALEVVDVANNLLTGTLVPSIGRLSNLRYLLLGRNSLSGTIPGEIGLLSSLELLGLETNALEGSIPTEIGQLENLTRLNLARNGLSSSLPSELGNLAKLQLLDASKQSLAGEIPSTVGNLRELLILNLMGNDLSGTIPSGLGRCTSLLEMQLQRNNLSGTIGEEVCNLRLDYFLDNLRVDCVSKVDCDLSCCTRCT